MNCSPSTPRVFLPVPVDHVALAFTKRSSIHASTETSVQMIDKLGRTHRTLCGVDAFLVVHRSKHRPDLFIGAPWPPPAELRCPDCAERTGVGSREAKGALHWQQLEGGES